MRRIVRQTARELDKDVDLEIIGETSEVDRTVLDRIIAPLEHMLRNSVSHGIELPEVRGDFAHFYEIIFKSSAAYLLYVKKGSIITPC